MTCGVIIAPATSIATTSPASEPRRPPSPPTSSANAPSSTGSRRCNGARPRPQRVERPRPAPTSTDHADSSTPPSAAEPAAAVDRGHADLDAADDQPEPERREHDRAQRPAPRARRTGPWAAAGSRRAASAPAGSARTRRAHHHRPARHHQCRCPATAQHQQRRQRRPEDEEHLQADRLVAVSGVAAAARAAPAAPTERGTRPGMRGLDEPDDDRAAPEHRHSGARDSTAQRSARPPATANSTAATSSGRVGPSRSISRPCTTDPQRDPDEQARRHQPGARERARRALDVEQRRQPDHRHRQPADRRETRGQPAHRGRSAQRGSRRGDADELDMPSRMTHSGTAYQLFSPPAPKAHRRRADPFGARAIGPGGPAARAPGSARSCPPAAASRGGRSRPAPCSPSRGDAPTSWAISSCVRSWVTRSRPDSCDPNCRASCSSDFATRPGTSVKIRSASMLLVRRSLRASTRSSCSAISGRLPIHSRSAGAVHRVGADLGDRRRRRRARARVEDRQLAEHVRRARHHQQVLPAVRATCGRSSPCRCR